MNITISELIDRLSIINVKVFHLVDIIENSNDEKEIAYSAKKAQELNKQRSLIKNEIETALSTEATKEIKL